MEEVRSVARTKSRQPEKSSLKLVLWTALAGLVFGLMGFGELIEDVLRSSRNGLHPHKASGDIVLVKFDEDSLQEVGRWPWPRRHFATLNDQLDAAGAKRIFWDLVMDAPTTREDDAAFANALKRSGKVTLAALPSSGPSIAEAAPALVPIPQFRDHAQLGSISIRYNWQNAVWRMPYKSDFSGSEIDGFSTQLAGRSGKLGETFIPDYSIDPRSIVTVPANDVLRGRFDPAIFAGKDILIGGTASSLGDELFIPGTGRMGGAFVHIISAETLKAGKPLYLGWIPFYALALAVAGLAATRRAFNVQVAIIAAAMLVILVAPTAGEANLVFLDITPALFVLLCVGSVLTSRGFRQRGLVNTVSGLPNFSALRANRSGRNQALIAARIINYEEIVATLPHQSERELTDQIVSRLRVGAPDRTLFQGDGGLFAWFEETRSPFGNHLEALYALFRNPAKIAGRTIDLTISFGVEIGSRRSLSNRLASALVAADEAAHDGLKWKYHDPETLEDASWKLSMLSQLDAAVDKGEVWVAYQPKLDLGTRRIIGAEALARWTHPEKGPIAASEFIGAAEQHDRIGKLTDFILDSAIAAIASINKRNPGFGIAVNLSARLLTDTGFVLRLGAKLARHGVKPELLTLELTETATLAGSGSGIDMLGSLRDLGVKISIDDYGTGLSTLDYLKKVPASELKIDQSFVKGMVDSRSDRLMVQSTIGLAHSLGRKVVAEGVERKDILDLLVEMGCDIAQGFIIGRPMSLDSLTKRISTGKKSQVA